MRLLTLWRGKLTKLVATVDAFCAFDYLLIRALHIKKKRNAKAMVVCRKPQLSLKSTNPLSWRGSHASIVVAAMAVRWLVFGTDGQATWHVGEIGMYLGGAARRRPCSHGQLHTLFPHPTLTNLSPRLLKMWICDEEGEAELETASKVYTVYGVAGTIRLLAECASYGSNETDYIVPLRHEQVTVLRLYSKGLEGSLSPHVGNVTFLRKLSLINNTFQGTIPHELGCLSRLRHLYHEDNKFSGVIPANLSGCSNLKKLWLSGNKLVGSIHKEMSLL
ncbi:kinase-like domain-containing protein [Tanacetum coccineum]